MVCQKWAKTLHREIKQQQQEQINEMESRLFRKWLTASKTSDDTLLQKETS